MSVQQEQQILKRKKQLPVAKFGGQQNFTNGPVNPNNVPHVRTVPLSTRVPGNRINILAPSSNKCRYSSRGTREPCNPYNIVQYEEPKQCHGSQESHVLSYHVPGPSTIAATGVSSSSTSINSTADSMILVKESTLGVLTKQLTSSLTRMKEIEEQVKIIPELKQRLDYLISNYSEDEQTLTPVSFRATSNESMNLNRRLTKPSMPLPHREDPCNQDISSSVTGRRKLETRRNASSSCDYSRDRDRDMSTKDGITSDTCSLGSLKLGDCFSNVDKAKNPKEGCAVSDRVSTQNVDYDDILNDLFSLFESFEAQPSLPKNGSKASRLDEGQTRARLPKQVKVNQRQHHDYKGRGSTSLPHLPDVRDTLKSPRGGVLTNCIEPMLEAANDTTDVRRRTSESKREGLEESSKIDHFDSSEKAKYVPAYKNGVYKTCLTINSTDNGLREAETQTNSDWYMPSESHRTNLVSPGKADLSTNTDLFMNDLITRKQLNELLRNLKLTPKQTMKCMMICSRTGKRSKPDMTNNLPNGMKNSRTTRDQIQSDSTDDSDDQTLSGGDTYSICSSHEDLSGFEGYFNGSYCRSTRDDFYQVDSPVDLMTKVT